MTTAVIVDARRTWIGVAGRSLRGVGVESLAGPVLAALAAGSPDRTVDRVVLGNCLGPGGNPARSAALAAGLGVATPATTVDLQCASGLAAVADAAGLVSSGAARTVLAGGSESASTAPWRSWPPTADHPEPRHYTRAPFAPSGFPDPEMGEAADRQARAYGITREQQDAYAVRSHARATAAHAAGRFAAETVAVGGLDRDEQVRPRLTGDLVARLLPVFGPDGTVTVATSSAINDGAAAVTVVDAAQHAANGGPGLAIRGWAVAGVDPALPGRGLVPAVQQVLRGAGLGLDDVGAVEFTEAFAGQVLACCAELDLDPERVCLDGGALALGHPWGASGAVLLVRLFSRLRSAEPGTYGLAAVSAGGGQGVAMLVERI